MLVRANKLHVLFLCTGNACRSQMAEGWARHLAGDRLEASSAGIEAHGKNPLAISVMHEAGIDISKQGSTQLTEEMLHGVDMVVTVCGHAHERCPVLPADIKKEHWPIIDPARATGSGQEIRQVFCDVRDDIGHRVEDLIKRVTRET
ncbi:MAG: arsenate reductase ArsC [Gammaproteobacteria bacterium]